MAYVKTRPVRAAELTPAARADIAKRRIAEGIADLIAAEIAMGAATSEWVSQTQSPLGKRRHLEAVRSGELRGHKVGHKVLVRRADLNAYIEERAIHVTKSAAQNELQEEEREVERLYDEYVAHASSGKKNGRRP